MRKEPFSAKANRAKRPLPLWVDAIVRDTQHLAADEYGCYMRILQAMWSRTTCDFPFDHHKLARIGGVSPRLWKTRIWPNLEGFFVIEGDTLWQRRLRKEAGFVEQQVANQSNRKMGEKSLNPLQRKELGPSADDMGNYPWIVPRYHPSYNLQKEEEEGYAREAPPPASDAPPNDVHPEQHSPLPQSAS